MAEYIEKWSIVNRLIDIENEFQQYKPFHGFEHAMYRKICEAEIAIGKTQTADVAPVVHGQWITEFDDLGWLKHTYTVCGYTKRTDVHVSLGWNYCPNCGAKMEGGDEE